MVEDNTTDENSGIFFLIQMHCSEQMADVADGSFTAHRPLLTAVCSCIWIKKKMP